MTKLSLTVASLGWSLAAAVHAGGPGTVAERPADVCPLPIGSKVPSVRVTAADGTPRDLASVTAGKPAVLIFFRGGW